MKSGSYVKILSANDIGLTGGHQAGICVPKRDADLLAFFPPLDASIKNPDAWIWCEDEFEKVWKFRYVYYNNRLHEPDGTRNEYRITWMTEFLRQCGAKPGDSVVFENKAAPDEFRVRLDKTSRVKQGIIKLVGWRRLH